MNNIREWDDILPVGGECGLNFSASLLPAPFDQYAKSLAEDLEIAESVTVMLCLSVVSIALTKKFLVCCRDGWYEPLNLYFLTALPPGNNKSAALTKAMQPLKKWEKDQFHSLYPAHKKQVARQEVLALQIEEKKKAAAKAKTQGIADQILAEIESLEGQIECVKPLPQLFVTDCTPESLTDLVAKHNGKMAIVTDEGGVFEVLSGLYSRGTANIDIILKGIDGGEIRVKRKMQPGQELYKYSGLGSKIVGYCLRIAGLLHVAEYGQDSSHINAKTLQNAITLSHFLLTHAIVAFNYMYPNQDVAIGDEIVKWIRSNKLTRFTKGDLLRAFRNRKIGKAQAMTKVIETLYHHNIVQSFVDKSTAKPTVVYLVNPKLF